MFFLFLEPGAVSDLGAMGTSGRPPLGAHAEHPACSPWTHTRTLTHAHVRARALIIWPQDIKSRDLGKARALIEKLLCTTTGPWAGDSCLPHLGWELGPSLS